MLQSAPAAALQVVAGAFTLASLAVSEYFVQRTLFIEDFEELTGAGPGIPCGTAWTAREIVTEGLEDDLITGLFWLGAVVAAVVVAGTARRRHPTSLTGAAANLCRLWHRPAPLSGGVRPARRPSTTT